MYCLIYGSEYFIGVSSQRTVGPGLKGHVTGLPSKARGFDCALLAEAFAHKLLKRSGSAFPCNALSDVRKSFPVCLLPFFFFFFSDPSAILNIEKAISSGTALVLYNIDRDVDSLFMPLIYHITTSTSEEIEQGMLASLRCY